MNILMLTSIYPQPDDNDYKTTPTVKYFCEEWARQGHSVIVIHNGSIFPKVLYYIPKPIKTVLEKRVQIQFPGKESRLNLVREEKGVIIYRLNMLKYIPHAAYSKHAIDAQARKIHSILEGKCFNPDVIIGHWANPQVPLISNLKRRYYPTSCSAVVFHNDCNDGDVKRYSLLDYMKDIEKVGCRNVTYGKIISKNLHLETSPFLCSSGIPNDVVSTVDIEGIIEKKIEGSILYVGRIVKYKNVDSIIEAIHRRSNQRSFSLEIVGNGSDMELVNGLVSEYSYEDYVTFFSKLTRSEVFKHMASHECFTMISTNEVFGMVYLEAMLMGCITIASRGGALDGIIQDGVNGFLCDAGNAEELSEIYDRISSMSNDQKTTMMRLASQTAKDYSDEKVARRYLESIIN